jgi:hypothetical protein
MYNLNPYKHRHHEVNYKVIRTIDSGVQLIYMWTDSENPLSKQAICIGEKMYKLEYFTKTPTNLIYEFEKDVVLRFYIRKYDVIINLKSKRKTFSKQWTGEASKYVYEQKMTSLTPEFDFINIMINEKISNI